MEPVIFFSSPPILEELCALTVQIKVASYCKAISQPHVLKCRELIFSETSIIASPSFDLDHCFNIIIQISVFKTGRLQSRLKKLELEFSKPFRVHPILYQSCLRYTLTTRLAPSWNKAGEWHIQGRDFVFQSGYINAVKVNLCVNKEEIFASLSGTVLRFPPLQVEDLNLSHQEMLNILKSTQEDGRQVDLQDSWCHVLPSMKRGRILSVSLLMPPNNPFSGYNELKRHWKNTYGYRLPETDEDILYCQVSFLPSGTGKQFTYPDTCLRIRPAQCMSRVDCKPILSSFIQDVHAKVGSVCGQPLRFTPKMHFTSLSLHDANEEVPHASLSNKRCNKKENTKVPLRSSQDITKMKQKTFSHDQPSLRCRLVGQTGYDDAGALPPLLEGKDVTNEDISNNSKLNSQSNRNRHIGGHHKHNENHSMAECEANSSLKPLSPHVEKITDQNIVHSSFSHKDKMNLPLNINTKNSHLNRKKQPISVKISNFETIDNKQTLTNTRTSSTPPSSTFASSMPQSKLVPIFWPRKKNSINSVLTKEPKPQNSFDTSKFVPVFKPKRPSSSLSAIKTNSDVHNLEAFKTKSALNSLTSKTSSTTPTTMVSFSSSSNSIIRNSKINVSTPSFTTQPPQQTGAQPPIFPVFTTKTKPSIHSNNKQNTKTKVSSQSVHFRQSQSYDKKMASSNSPQPSPSLPLSQSMGKNYTATPKAVSHLSSKELHLPEDFASNQWKGKANSLPSMPTSCHNMNASPHPSLMFGSTSTGSAIPKRKIELSTQEPSTPTTKKARPKAQVQDLNIDSLVKSNQLNKANTATLMSWLKERGVTCRSKDKKSDLIEKVRAHLNLSVSEP